jgi:hypothetical protein
LSDLSHTQKDYIRVLKAISYQIFQLQKPTPRCREIHRCGSGCWGSKGNWGYQERSDLQSIKASLQNQGSRKNLPVNFIYRATELRMVLIFLNLLNLNNLCIQDDRSKYLTTYMTGGLVNQNVVSIISLYQWVLVEYKLIFLFRVEGLIGYSKALWKIKINNYNLTLEEDFFVCLGAILHKITCVFLMCQCIQFFFRKYYPLCKIALINAKTSELW